MTHLDADADDYITKAIRVDTRRRGSRRRDRALLDRPRLEADHDTDGEVRLTPTEWNLVEILVRNAGKLITEARMGYCFIAG